MLLALALPLSAACDDSVETNSVLEEPLRFRYQIGSAAFDAQFFPGELPAPSGGPAVAGVDIGPNQVAPGTVDKGGYVVRLADNAYSVALRLQGRSNGYWVARVNQVEAINANQVSAAIFFDVSPAATPGRYRIEVSGIDGQNRFGERALAPLDIIPRVPADAPAVISLRWDAAVDLDLQIAAPGGTFLSPKRPTTAPVGAPDAGTAPGYGHSLGDSMAACVNDGYRQEDVLFTATPVSGTYAIYVNPYSLCGQQGTAYEVMVSRKGIVTDRYVGRISAPEVQQGGFGLGDHVADVSF
ncbi:MAG: uncharacterized protein JWP97_4241 [Labilithrix sp.]|nr:uncharacterized protein [Labilithrix sp.]